ncbi:dihydrodipicolinate synthetase [Myriangium duriaei CBS 260.36]|uniref:Dihydrodipicolinate synthetase n=1 Tax=Myriangium duriaei CBS 260.36 TaxID=1168546 RepID=A0A9P4IZU0_9PEZI|nr:dihydrodipicolinate synthetase [Myriangium duriaei CBS 260.36]
MSTQRHRYSVPPSGCYVPAVTFYTPDAVQSLDLAAQKKYFRYLSTTGLRGIVVLGSNAETLLLTREERIALVETARAAVPKDYPLIAGIMGHSTAQVIEYAADAAEAGADYFLLLPCAYFGKQTTPAVIKSFFADIAPHLPRPTLIYNFPAVTNGVDLDSDIIADIARANDIYVGVKLTCGSVAKIARLAGTFPPERFAVFGGQSDFLVGGLAVGSSGCIAAFANIFPKSVARLYDLYASGRHAEARRLQHALALAEAPTKAGIANTKYAAAVYTAGPWAGVERAEEGARPRHPYKEPGKEEKEKIRRVMEPYRWLEDGKGKGKSEEYVERAQL